MALILAACVMALATFFLPRRDVVKGEASLCHHLRLYVCFRRGNSHALEIDYARRLPNN